LAPLALAARKLGLALAARKLGPALAARKLGPERIEVRAPEPAKLVEPGIDRTERLGRDRVEAPRALGPHGRESALA
jgi:hypothetical protein